MLSYFTAGQLRAIVMIRFYVMRYSSRDAEWDFSLSVSSSVRHIVVLCPNIVNFFHHVV